MDASLRLGQSLQVPDCPRELVPTVVKIFHQRPGTESHPVVFIELDIPSARSPSQGIVKNATAVAHINRLGGGEHQKLC